MLYWQHAGRKGTGFECRDAPARFGTRVESEKSVLLRELCPIEPPGMTEAMEQILKRSEREASSRFMSAVSAAGLCIFVCATVVVVTGSMSLEWVLLSLVTTLVVSRTSVRIPKTDSTVTLDDTFIYLSFLLYG